MSSNNGNISQIELLRAIRDCRALKGSDLLLMFALALRSNTNDGYVSWPSYRQLAEDTGCDKVTLQRAAKRLEEGGFIRRKSRSHQSNRFYINAEVIVAKAAESPRRREKDADAPAPKTAPPAPRTAPPSDLRYVIKALKDLSGLDGILTDDEAASIARQLTKFTDSEYIRLQAVAMLADSDAVRQAVEFHAKGEKAAGWLIGCLRNQVVKLSRPGDLIEDLGNDADEAISQEIGNILSSRKTANDPHYICVPPETPAHIMQYAMDRILEGGNIGLGPLCLHNGQICLPFFPRENEERPAA